MVEIYDRVAHLRARGDEAMLVTVVDREGSAPALPGAKMLVVADGTTIGTVGGGALEYLATSKALALLRERRSVLVTYSLGEDGHGVHAEPLPMACGGRISLFYDYLGYPAHIYIFGAGHIGRAIAYHLKGVGCHVTVMDHRPELASGLEGADRVLIGGYDEVLQDEVVPPEGFFVIATPSHTYDYVVLHRIFASGWCPRYVGLLASRKKAADLRQQLRQDLGEGLDTHALYTPVGLDLGGGSPQEIAIAVVAEIQAVRYGKQGHHHLSTR